MSDRFRRPGRRPGIRRRGRGLTILCLLGIGIGLIYLRSSLNLSIYDASRTLEERRRTVEMLEGRVEGVEVEIDQLVDLPRLGPRAEKLGLAPPSPEAVYLLPVSTALAFRGARPLPGAGALGRLVRRAVDLAGARRAAAASEPAAASRGRAAAVQTPRASQQNLQIAQIATGMACAPVPGCEHCRTSRTGTSHPEPAGRGVAGRGH